MNTEPNSHIDHPRRAVRQKSFLRGTINFNNACSTFDCLIRDISPEGARLDFSGTVSMPDIFDLYVPQKEQTFCANVAWRHGEEVGVAFARRSVIDRVPVADGLAKRVIRLEAEIGTLKRACMRVRSSITPSLKI